MAGPIPQLPPQFEKLAALFLSSTFAGERDTARRKAEAILPPEVGGFERGLRVRAYHQARAAAPGNPLAGWDERQAIDDPGHMDRCRANRAKHLDAWHARRAALVERYGSLDAATMPCEREKALLKALKPWRVASKRPHQRWTWELKGWEYANVTEKMPADLRAAVEGALPMPATFAEAEAELAYWRARDRELQDALGKDGDFLGDYGLDRVCIIRMEIIRDLVDHGMRLTTLPDIMARFRIFRDRENLSEDEMEGALFRDLEAFAVAHPELMGEGPDVGQGFVSRNELLKQEGKDWAQAGGDR